MERLEKETEIAETITFDSVELRRILCLQLKWNPEGVRLWKKDVAEPILVLERTSKGSASVQWE